MKKDLIYFGDACGLTNTSANHIANMAKESAKEVATTLGCITFLDATVSTIEGSTPQKISIGSKREQLEDVQASLERIGEANALIAWLREAIKARARLLDEVRNMTLEGYAKTILGGIELPRPDVTFEQFCKERGYDMPDVGIPSGVLIGTTFERFCDKFGIDRPKEPKQEPAMTEEDYLATLSVKDRNHLLELEAKASTIGRYIPGDGHLAKQRERLSVAITKPIIIEGEGRDKLIYQFEPSVSQVEVDSLFFRLAARHRELQAELNRMLAQQERAIEADKQAKAAQYQRDYAEYAAKRNALMDKMTAYMNGEKQRLSQYQAEFENWKNEQQNRHAQLVADLAAWKLKEAERISHLGIIIPDNLKAIYDRVRGLGK